MSGNPRSVSSLPCIYCKDPKGPFKGDAHVFPEGLVANPLVLPSCTVCDPCNSYLGANVDSALIAFPYFALAIQVLGLPGKAGRPRRRIANVERDEGGDWVTVPIAAPKKVAAPDGGTAMNVRPIVDKTFRMPAFSRALYHVALNVLALEVGHRFVLREHLDGARRYVRSPGKGAFMPFLLTASSLENIRAVVRGRRATEAPGETVVLQIFNYDFYIDLLNRGGLVEWAQRTLDTEFHYIDDACEPPAEADAPGRMYRIRLELNE